MATKKPQSGASSSPKLKTRRGSGGELHQLAREGDTPLTTNQGTPISDNQNSLKGGSARGPTLLEDFVLREKITHFDHERIPERIVHARGSGAHGYFQPSQSWSKLTRASFLQDPNKKTPVFVRFSTVAGGAGSIDLPRDVRGFAVKFYTDEGNFDLVGNNIPVFFIQDAMKFPDLIHSVKMEPDRGYPQAGSAHDTFWDFVSLMPESFHMILWAMSDRTLPRSYRMMEGFGIHTFKLVNAQGKATFVKFHWRPTIGSQSVLWDEAVKISGADTDYHRRDLYESIADGAFPEWELAVQAFDERTAAKLPFDILDPTKQIPEETVPLTVLGKMVLNRNPDNFFSEVEQVAFHPGHVVPGIDFTEDPLLAGRLHSYVDTQLSRLGGANFHQLPINAPRCPMRNFTRDGMMQMQVPKGRVAYEPNTLDEGSPRIDPKRGFVTHPSADFSANAKVRERSPSFSDHYSQARQFFRSMSDPEKRHIVSAFAFELGKVQTKAIRTRVLGHIKWIDAKLSQRVEAALGMEGLADEISPTTEPIDQKASNALSLVKKALPTLQGRKVAVLVTDGCDGDLLGRLRASLKREGAKLDVVAPKIGGVKDANQNAIEADHALSGAPSCLFDALVVLSSSKGIKPLLNEAAAIDWVRDGFGHLKVLGFDASARPLLDKAHVQDDEGIVPLEGNKGVSGFIAAAKTHRIWEREPKLRSPG